MWVDVYPVPRQLLSRFLYERCRYPGHGIQNLTQFRTSLNCFLNSNWAERDFSFAHWRKAFLVIIPNFLSPKQESRSVERPPEILIGLPEIEPRIWLVRMPTRCHFSLVFEGNFQNGCWPAVTSIFLDSSPTMWVFKCLLSCIYLLLYLKSVIAILCQQIRSYFSSSLRTCAHGKNIRDDSRNLTKLPRHISFVVLESDISFVDLAQLIVWSMAMGIPYISVYDREGKTYVCIYLKSLPKNDATRAS